VLCLASPVCSPSVFLSRERCKINNHGPITCGMFCASRLMFALCLSRERLCTLTVPSHALNHCYYYSNSKHIFDQDHEQAGVRQRVRSSDWLKPPYLVSADASSNCMRHAMDRLAGTDMLYYVRVPPLSPKITIGAVGPSGRRVRIKWGWELNPLVDFVVDFIGWGHTCRDGASVLRSCAWLGELEDVNSGAWHLIASGPGAGWYFHLTGIKVVPWRRLHAEILQTHWLRLGPPRGRWDERHGEAQKWCCSVWWGADVLIHNTWRSVWLTLHWTVAGVWLGEPRPWWINSVWLRWMHDSLPHLRLNYSVWWRW
jgi:hypothetical protein